jgi:hypothetical protein
MNSEDCAMEGFLRAGIASLCVLFAVQAAATLLVGCSAPSNRPEHCKAPYAHTVLGCQAKRPPTRKEMKRAGMIEWCDFSTARKHCVWVPRARAERVLRRMQDS